MDCLLPESLDITTVIDSASQYSEWLEQNDSLQIDASNVRRTDAAGVQLLTSLFFSATKNQIAIELVQAPPLLLDSITTLGLIEQFGAINSLEEQ